MGTIILKKTAPTPTRTLTIKNLQSLDISIDMPAMIYAIPESTDEDAIGMKVEGNQSTVNISWTLVDEDSTVVSEMTGADAVETADEQMVFLIGMGKVGGNATASEILANKNSMQSSGVEYAYQLELKDNSGTTFFTKSGIITKVNVSKSGSTPVTYSATVMFSTAEMIAEQENAQGSQ
mgnify:CR=1 FL=1|tara:strand:- start:408 stop:944 length:537 start_codon:yes stop_codon:yes gene_type:complete